MAATQTFTDKHAARAKDLYDNGNGCRAIAAELGFSPARISKWAKDNNLPFDRSQAAMAVRAHVVDLAAARAELAQMMVVAAVDTLHMLEQPYLVYNFGGQFNDFASHELDEAPVEVRRNAITTAGIAFDKATKFLETVDDGESEAVSMLTALAEQLGVKGPLDADQP